MPGTRTDIRNHEIDFLLWEEELRRHRASSLIRRLGGFVLKNTERLNNDPLAHVWLLAGSKAYDEPLLTRIQEEFITDMAERSPRHENYHVFPMRVTDNDIVSASGLRMRQSMQYSLEVTANDAKKDSRRQYGLRREEIQYEQLDKIIEWANDLNSSRFFGFASLCPPSLELDEDAARVNGFKPDRLMASLWFYEKTDNGIVMHAFSLDQCTRELFQVLLDACSIDHAVKSDTLEQLASSISFNDPTTVQDLRDMWWAIPKNEHRHGGSAVNAADIVKEQPQALATYLKFVTAITDSLSVGFVNKQLAELLNTARSFVGGDKVPVLKKYRYRRLTVEDARELMQFVRSRMIPHYLYSDSEPGHSGSGIDSVLSVSGSAAGMVESYDGACPSSSFTSVSSELSALTSFGLFNRQLTVDQIMMKKRQGDCLSCDAKRTIVFGCGFCRECNGIWCDEYKRTGRGLSIREVSQLARRFRAGSWLETIFNGSKCL